MDALEALETCRAIRYLKPDPVPNELIERVIWGATRASSPGNSQGWDFVVVTDHSLKQQLREIVEPALERATAALASGDLAAPEQRLLAGARHLAGHLDQVPALIVVPSPAFNADV